MDFSPFELWRKPHALPCREDAEIRVAGKPGVKHGVIGQIQRVQPQITQRCVKMGAITFAQEDQAHFLPSTAPMASATFFTEISCSPFGLRSSWRTWAGITQREKPRRAI